MATDRMYEAAFRFREMELWESLNDSDLFAVTLPDGRIGYCCVMGNGGEHYAMVIYTGDKGWQTYCRAIDSSTGTSMIEMQLFACSIDQTSCDFESADFITPQAKNEAREYAKRTGTVIRRKKGYPEFIRIKPGHAPWKITGKEDEEAIYEALLGGLEVGRVLQEEGVEELLKRGFLSFREYPIPGRRKKIPLLKRDGEKFNWSKTTLPPYDPGRNPAPTLFNNPSLTTLLLSMKGEGVFQCRFTYAPAEVQTDKDKAPVVPGWIFTLDENDWNIIPTVPEPAMAEDLAKLPESLGDTFAAMNRKPSVIKVCDPTTEALLEDFCGKTGITLQMVKALPQVDGAFDSICQMMRRGY